MSKTTRKILVGIAGTIVLLFGIVLIVLPGPAILVIPAGLAILATEFEWAGRLLQRLRAKFQAWRTKKKAAAPPAPV